jgi:hypothetical protein
MNCGCVKYLGCFIPAGTIDFGMLAPYSGDYTFEIFANGGFSTFILMYNVNEPLMIPFTFNEDSETIIKIKFESAFATSAINYVTSSDGACSFSVSGMVPQCN